MACPRSTRARPRRCRGRPTSSSSTCAPESSGPRDGGRADAKGDATLELGYAVYAGACASCHEAGRTLSSAGAMPLPLAIAVHNPDPANWSTSCSTASHRSKASIDGGETVSPDGIFNPVEGGVVQSLSWWLFA